MYGSSYSEQVEVGYDWESLISQGLEARELKDQSQWRLGELADKVDTQYGKDTIGMFAVGIGVNKSSLLRYRDVYRAFKGKEINPALSFSHHMKVVGTDDPEKWLVLAYEGGWSVERLGLEIDALREKKNDDRPRKCETCRKWVVISGCTCNK